MCSKCYHSLSFGPHFNPSQLWHVTPQSEILRLFIISWYGWWCQHFKLCHISGSMASTLYTLHTFTENQLSLEWSRTRFNGTNGRVDFLTYFHVISLLQTFLPCFQFHAFSNICNQTGWSIYMISPIWYYCSDQSHSKCIQIMKRYLDKQC